MMWTGTRQDKLHLSEQLPNLTKKEPAMLRFIPWQRTRGTGSEDTHHDQATERCKTGPAFCFPTPMKTTAEPVREVWDL